MASSFYTNRSPDDDLGVRQLAFDDHLNTGLDAGYAVGTHLPDCRQAGHKHSTAHSQNREHPRAGEQFRSSLAPYKSVDEHTPIERRPEFAGRGIDGVALPVSSGSDLGHVDTGRVREMLVGAAGEEWQDSVACPYRAKLQLAMLSYAERSRRHPGSQKWMITSSNEADLSETVPAAWDAMGRLVTNPLNPRIFQRNGFAVFLQWVGEGALARLIIRQHTPTSMHRETSEAIYWYSGWATKRLATGGDSPLSGEELDPVIAVIDAAEALPHARIIYTPPSDSSGKALPESWDVTYPAPHYPNWTVSRCMAAALPENISLPLLEAVAGLPVLSKDGTRLLKRGGYYPAESIYIDCPEIGESPPVQECVARLDGLFGKYAENALDRKGFPFDSPASRAHLYACLVAGVIGPAVQKKPVFMFDKATPRTGATFMAETVSLILTGDMPTYVRAGSKARGSVEEMAKGLSAAASQTNGVILMDNATGTLDDAEWNRYVTSEIWESRLLGTSNRTVRVSRRGIVDILTANNIQLTTEAAGRVCISRLDAGMEHPDERSFEWTPQERCRENRWHYVAAVVGLVEHWLACGGKLEHGLTGWGGFEEWRDMTARILTAAGISGFGQSVDLAVADRIDDGGEKAFVRWWWETHGQTPVGVREMSLPETLGDDTTGQAGILTRVSGHNARARSTSLGSQVKTWLGRVYEMESGETVAIRSAGTSNNRALYRLVPLSPPADCEV